MLQWLLALIVFVIHRLIAMTWRVIIVESDAMKKDMAEGKPFVLAHWHGEQSGLVLIIRRYKVTIMTSQSKDGQIMTHFVEFYGAKTVRGSSSKGAVGALKGMIRLTQSGHIPSISVDGPRGPYHTIKPGVFEISRLIDGRIYPGVVVPQHAWPFKKTWDGSFFPKPFTKLVILWDEPMGPISRAADSRNDDLARELVQRFETARQKALKYIEG
jgi:lysophospholipid acyltransferase (LPLAT)-like uncharacterized protein